MNNNSRTKNSFINISVTMIYQVLSILGNFILRTIFIKTISTEYLGISSLFTNILSVLSLAELGVGNAIIYSMYKPLKENDEKKLSGLVTYYKKLYSRIGILVLILGLLVVPFLPQIVKLDNDIPYITLYYIMYLINSVSTYFMVYKTTIVKADQKEFLLTKYNIIFLVLKLVLQSISLIIFKNFFAYLLIQIILSILLNYVMSRKSEKMYTFIKQKNSISEEEKKSIWENIKSLFMYQIGSVSLNSTDNIIISIIVSTIVVGVYSNYSMIVSSISTFTSLIFTSIIASIGNYNVESSPEEKEKMFNILEFMSFWIYGFCSICLIVLCQDFINIWAGDNYLLSQSTLYIIVINYYITGILYPIFCFRNTTNLFKTAKYIMLIATIINIILSILLGKVWGLNGILIATAISRILTNLWYEPYILFRDYFKSSVYKYHFKKILEIIVLCIIILITQKISLLLKFENVIITFIYKIIICIIIPNLILFILSYRRKEFKFILNKVKKNIIQRA